MVQYIWTKGFREQSFPWLHATHSYVFSAVLFSYPMSSFKPGSNLLNWLLCVRFIAKSCLTLLQLHGLKPATLLCPRDFSGKNTRMGCHSLLQGTFLTQGSNSHLLYCPWILYYWLTREAPKLTLRPMSMGYAYWSQKYKIYFRDF